MINSVSSRSMKFVNLSPLSGNLSTSRLKQSVQILMPSIVAVVQRQNYLFELIRCCRLDISSNSFVVLLTKVFVFVGKSLHTVFILSELEWERYRLKFSSTISVCLRLRLCLRLRARCDSDTGRTASTIQKRKPTEKKNIYILIPKSYAYEQWRNKLI